MIIENWKVELRARGETLAEVKIQKGFQRDSLLPLLFVIAMMPLSYICRKCSGDFTFTKSQEKINHFDDIKIFAKNIKELGTLIQTIRIYSQNIGIEFGIEKCALLIMKIGEKRNN